MKYQQIVLGGLVAAGFAVSAWAHSGATGVVAERMDGMKTMQDAVKGIAPMFAGQAEYDAATVRAAAADIAAQSGHDMTSKFPEGTDGHPSEARPEIWSDWDQFTALADQLERMAKGLGLAAENGLHAGSGMMGGTSGMMGGGTSGMMGGGTSGMMGSGAAGMMGGGAAGMMGGGTMPMAGTMTVEQIGQMPADGAFGMMVQTCSACHDRFRMEH